MGATESEPQQAEVETAPARAERCKRQPDVILAVSDDTSSVHSVSHALTDIGAENEERIRRIFGRLHGGAGGAGAADDRKPDLGRSASRHSLSTAKNAQPAATANSSDPPRRSMSRRSISETVPANQSKAPPDEDMDDPPSTLIAEKPKRLPSAGKDEIKSAQRQQSGVKRTLTIQEKEKMDDLEGEDEDDDGEGDEVIDKSLRLLMYHPKAVACVLRTTI